MTFSDMCPASRSASVYVKSPYFAEERFHTAVKTMSKEEKRRSSGWRASSFYCYLLVAAPMLVSRARAGSDCNGTRLARNPLSSADVTRYRFDGYSGAARRIVALLGRISFTERKSRRASPQSSSGIVECPSRRDTRLRFCEDVSCSVVVHFFRQWGARSFPSADILCADPSRHIFRAMRRAAVLCQARSVRKSLVHVRRNKECHSSTIRVRHRNERLLARRVAELPRHALQALAAEVSKVFR